MIKFTAMRLQLMETTGQSPQKRNTSRFFAKEIEYRNRADFSAFYFVGIYLAYLNH